MTDILLQTLYLSVILILFILLGILFYKNFTSSKNINDPPYNPHFEKLIMDKMEATSKSIENRFSELSIEFELRSKEMISVSQETKEEAQNLNQLLGNRTSRGAWGENVAQDILEHLGMIKGIKYERNKTLNWKKEDGGVLIPDFTIYIEGQSKMLIVDSKFPLDNYRKFFNEKGNLQTQKDFISDFKDRVDEVSKYINTSENTLGFAALFLPIPGILDAALSINTEIQEYAIKKQVVLLSPANLYALISFVQQSEFLFNIKQQHSEIAKVLEGIKFQYSKFQNAFEGMEKHLDRLKDSVTAIKTTRTNALGRSIDQIDEVINPSKQLDN